MRPFLALSILALLTAWLVWPTQSNVADASPSSATLASSLTLEDLPELASSEATIQRAVIPAEASPAPLAKKKEPAPDVERGTIYGQVMDTLGNPVSAAKILVFRRSEQVATAMLEGNDQQFVIDLTANQSYSLMVDPTSLVGGLVPPLKVSRHASLLAKRLSPTHHRFFLKQDVEVKPGQQTQLNLHVGLPGSALGRVLDPQGNPVAEVLVRFHNLDPSAYSQSEDSTTNARGEFAMAEIYPGTYRMQISRVANGPEESGWSIPAAKDTVFSPGQQEDFGDLYLGDGTQTVVGWIVNQDGDPFPGLPVLCYSNEPVEEGLPPHRMSAALTRVITDKNGRFELKNIEAIAVKVSITPDFYPGQAMGTGKPAMWEPNVELDLASGPAVLDLGELTVHESRPFKISGKLVFDSDWLTEGGHSKKDLKIQIRQVESEVLLEGVRRNPISRARVPIDWKALKYAYNVETPMTAVRLTFSLKGYPDLRFVVRPRALQSKSRTIHIPSDFVQ